MTLRDLIIFTVGASVGTTVFVVLWSGIPADAAAALARRLLPSLGRGRRALRRRPRLHTPHGHKSGAHRRPAHQRPVTS